MIIGALTYYQHYLGRQLPFRTWRDRPYIMGHEKRDRRRGRALSIASSFFYTFHTIMVERHHLFGAGEINVRREIWEEQLSRLSMLSMLSILSHNTLSCSRDAISLELERSRREMIGSAIMPSTHIRGMVRCPFSHSPSSPSSLPYSSSSSSSHYQGEHGYVHSAAMRADYRLGWALNVLLNLVWHQDQNIV